MHEPDIAPLARRLAEENNVDWRRLAGSGAGGRVVERDVLGYLARVMAGDEAVDPTPEPVPDGMVAWPEDDVAAYRARADEPPAASPPTLDDELFLFDDPVPEPADARVDRAFADAAAPWPTIPSAARYGGGSVASDDDAVLLMGEDDGPDLRDPTGRAPDPSVDGVRFDELPDLTESDPIDPDPTELPTIGAVAKGAVHPVADARADLDLPDLFAPGRAPDVEGTRRAGPDLLFEDDDALEAMAGEAGGSDGELVLEEPTPSDDLGLTPVEAAYPGEGDDEVDPTVAADLDDTVPTRSSDPRGEAATDGTSLAAAAPPTVAVAVPPGTPGVTFVRHGQVWRRRFDDRPLRQAVSEVAAELEAAPSAVAAVLLARAALRTGAATGPIDAVRWRGGALVRGTASTDADLRAAVRAVERAEVGAGEAATLVVADLADLDVDEAVLHLEVPVLTLGRASGGGSWLCLAGDEVDDAAVDALAPIAMLLATPVRLLV